MKTTRKLNRRSFFGTVAGGAVLTGSLSLIGDTAGAMQVTDCDSGTGGDPGGRGTGRRPRTGRTDSDGGAAADPPGCGRGGGQQPAAPSGGQTETGRTDSDPVDRAGYGRGSGSRPYTGITDSDSGPMRDPAGSGRGGNAAPRQPSDYTGITDRDTGPYADPGGQGRGTGGDGSTVFRQENCTYYRNRAEQIRRRLAEIEAGGPYVPLGEAERDLAAVEQLIPFLNTTLPDARYVFYERIRGITARYPLGCGPTDINCQINGLREGVRRLRALGTERDALQQELQGLTSLYLPNCR